MSKATTWAQAESTPPTQISAGREIVPDTEAPLAFKGLLVLTFIIYIAPQGFFPVLEPLRLALVSAVLAVGSYLMYVFMNGRPLITVMTTEVKLLLGLFALAVIMIPLSRWPGGSFSFLLEQYYKSIVLFLLVANLTTSDKRFRQLLWATGIFSAINGVVGIQAYLNGEFFMEGRIAGALSGITSNPNDLALTLNLALPFAWYLYKSSRSTIHKVAAVAIISLCVITIVITFSRGGFVTLLGLLLWFGLIKWKEHRGRVVLGGVLIFAGFMFLTPAGYSTRVVSIVDTKQDKTGSADARWEQWTVASQAIAQNPFGAGLNMNGLAMRAERGEVGWAGVHNVYLEIACDLGLLGGVIFIRLLWRLVAGMRNIRLTSSNRNWASLAEATEGSLVAYATAAMFHPVSYHFYFYYLAGIAVAVHEMTRRSGLNTERTK